EEKWRFDDLEEFLAAYSGSPVQDANMLLGWRDSKRNYVLNLEVWGWSSHSIVSVSAPSRAEIASIFAIFEELKPEDIIKLKQTPKPIELKIFIGHGQSAEWLNLKSHLQDKHHLQIEAYETGARAGHTIRDILDTMAKDSSFALLVLTGEDETA